MANRLQLNAETRTVLGKKVGRLRRSGLLPATVYGHNVPSESIQLDSHEFQGILKRSGRNQLIDLVIDGGPQRPVLVKQTSIDAKRNTLLHVEFFQANLREKITTHLPIHFVGESLAVREGGIFLQVLNQVDIESLPQDVPAGGIEVDISGITEINGAIHVSELSIPMGITLLTSGDEVVCKVNPPEPESVLEGTEVDEEGQTEASDAGSPPAGAVPEA